MLFFNTVQNLSICLLPTEYKVVFVYNFICTLLQTNILQLYRAKHAWDKTKQIVW